MNSNKIIKRLKEDYDFLESNNYNVFGVFLQGSQNYELDYEKSDIDTKSIVIPSLDDILLNKKAVSTTHILETNEHLGITDIRLMFDHFRKQKINFVEILFTKFFYINPEYQDLADRLFKNNEAIVHYNKNLMVNCIVGTMLEKKAALTHRYPSLAEIIDKYGYDGKQLHHIIRLEEFLRRYIAGEKFSDCLIPTNKEYLIEVKSNKGLYTKEKAQKLAVEYIEKAEKCKKEFLLNNTETTNPAVDELLNSVLLEAFKRNIKKNLM